MLPTSARIPVQQAVCSLPSTQRQAMTGELPPPWHSARFLSDSPGRVHLSHLCQDVGVVSINEPSPFPCRALLHHLQNNSSAPLLRHPRLCSASDSAHVLHVNGWSLPPATCALDPLSPTLTRCETGGGSEKGEGGGNCSASVRCSELPLAKGELARICMSLPQIGMLGA